MKDSRSLLMDRSVPRQTEPPCGHPFQMPMVARYLWLAGPLLILISSFLLCSDDPQAVSVPWFGITLPEMCHFRRLFGLDCPGCGLTRSFIHISHGNLNAAWQLNPLGIALYIYLGLQIPQALLRWQSVESRRRWLSDDRLARWTRINEWALIGLMIGLVIQWIFRWMWR